MTYKELQQQCPMIANSKHLFNSRKEAFLAQAEFFRKRSFVLKLLKPNQATVLDLRYGITNGEMLTCKAISEKLGISGARVLQIEEKAIKKLAKGKYLTVLIRYTDDTFDDALVENFNKIDYQNLLRQDFIRIIQQDDFTIVKDIKIEDLQLTLDRNRLEMDSIKSKLNSRGIIYCSDLIKALKFYPSGNQFVNDMDLAYSTYYILIEGLCGLINNRNIVINSTENRLKFLEHKLGSERESAQKKEDKVQRKQQIKQDRLMQQMINESKRQDRCRDGLINPELLLIEDLNLSARPYHKLKQEGIHTLQDLLDNNGEFRFIKNLGDKSIKQILLKLKELGIDVKYNINIPINELDMNNPQSVRIEDLGFSAPIYNVLKRNRINTLQDILNINYDLEGLKRVGPTSKHKVEQRLLELGIEQNK